MTRACGERAPWWRDVVVVVRSGLAAGFLVLGVGGRLAMAGLALAAGRRPVFTLQGSLEILLVGALYGAIGGLIALPLRRVLPGGGRRRGAVLGLVVFAVAIATSRAGRGALPAAPPLALLVLVVAGVMFAAYGILTERLSAR